MTSLLAFHAIAAARGDGLRPELRALLMRTAADPWSDLVPRYDGMMQSGPNPSSTKRDGSACANPDPTRNDEGDAVAKARACKTDFYQRNQADLAGPALT
jgi:hypothetical protein